VAVPDVARDGRQAVDQPAALFVLRPARWLIASGAMLIPYHNWLTA